MTSPSDRPALLKDAGAALAYERWLRSNDLEDSDAAAWRFAAEAATPSIAAPHHSRRRWWIPVSIVAAVLLLFGGVATYVMTTAEHWTKVDVEAQTSTVEIPTGTFIVTQEDTEACVVGQSYLGCINDMTAEYNHACAGRNLGDVSRKTCETYFGWIQEMKAGNPQPDSIVVAHEDGSSFPGRLTVTEITRSQQVVDVPEQTHDAICYVGFLGECPPAA